MLSTDSIRALDVYAVLPRELMKEKKIVTTSKGRFLATSR
jgi:hypothetical protein